MKEPERSDERVSYPSEGAGGPDHHPEIDWVAAERGGDFITSPEVGPLFGAVLARYVRAEQLAWTSIRT